MHQRPPTAVLLLTICGFGSLYVPQPLLPVLALDFGVSPADASLLISVTLLPLAVAPLLYGYVLEGWPAQRMVTVAAGALAVCLFAMTAVTAWWQLVLLRALEGLCLPALFTALMTQVAASARADQVRTVMAWYIAATIFGGFAGRAVSGQLAELWHWRDAFAFWGVGVAASLWGLRRSGIRGATHFARPHPQAFADVLSAPAMAAAYSAVFCMFFVFAGFLNVLPFRLRELAPDLGTGAIGLAYGGYLAGILVTLGGPWLRGRARSEAQLLGLAVGLYALGLAAFAIPRAAAIYLGMFAFCAGMFLIHGRLSGQVNQHMRRHQGLVNGIYIASYYLGGVIGSWLAPATYRGLGWEPLLGLLALSLAAMAIGLTRMLRRTAT